MTFCSCRLLTTPGDTLQGGVIRLALIFLWLNLEKTLNSATELNKFESGVTPTPLKGITRVGLPPPLPQ